MVLTAVLFMISVKVRRQLHVAVQAVQALQALQGRIFTVPL